MTKLDRIDCTKTVRERLLTVIGGESVTSLWLESCAGDPSCCDCEHVSTDVLLVVDWERLENHRAAILARSSVELRMSFTWSKSSGCC